MCLQLIMVVTCIFIILDWIFVLMNTTAMISLRPTLSNRLTIENLCTVVHVISLIRPFHVHHLFDQVTVSAVWEVCKISNIKDHVLCSYTEVWETGILWKDWLHYDSWRLWEIGLYQSYSTIYKHLFDVMAGIATLMNTICVWTCWKKASISPFRSCLT